MPREQNAQTFEIYSLPEEDEKEGEWCPHATGTVILPEHGARRKKELAAVPGGLSDVKEYVHDEDFADDSSSFLTNDREVLFKIALPETVDLEDHNFAFSPRLIEICLSSCHALFSEADKAMMPYQIDWCRFERSPSSHLICHARLRTDTPEPIFDLTISEFSGTVIAHMEGLHFKKVDQSLGQRQATERLLFELAWRSSANLPFEDPPSKGPYLIFAEEAGLTLDLEVQFRAAGVHATMVYPKGAPSFLEDDILKVDPENGHDFDRLLDRMFASGRPPLRIVYLWGLSMDIVSEASQRSVCGGLLHLIQALMKRKLPENFRLCIATKGAQDVHGYAANPAQATLWGFGKVAALEQPALSPLLVDLDPAASIIQLTDDLLKALQIEKREAQVAFRDSTAHVARIIRHRAGNRKKRVTIRKDAAYIITGGAGVLGMLLAKWLVEKGARHIVLVGRSGLKKHHRKQFEQLRAVAPGVEYVRADVSRFEEMQSLVSGLKQPLRGVIHAAGMISYVALMHENVNGILEIMRPKLFGAHILHILTKGLDLDFFVLFSSIASTLGTPGVGSYAAANSYMDSLAAHRIGQGLPGQSIQWGPWAGETGMAASNEGRGQNYWASRGVKSISFKEGLEVFERLFSEVIENPAVCHLNATNYLDRVLDDGAWALFSELSTAAKALTERRSEKSETSDSDRESFLDLVRSSSDQRAREILYEHIRNQLLKVLNLPTGFSIDPKRGFNQMGMDSLMSEEFRNRLQKTAGAHLSTTLIFDYPNLGALTQYVYQELRKEPEIEIEADSAAHSDLDDMSDDELLSLLADKISHNQED